MNIINGRDTQATVNWEWVRQMIQIIRQLGGEVANNTKIYLQNSKTRNLAIL